MDIIIVSRVKKAGKVLKILALIRQRVKKKLLFQPPLKSEDGTCQKLPASSFVPHAYRFGWWICLNAPTFAEPSVNQLLSPRGGSQKRAARCVERRVPKY
jgi:hypothetical protein